MSMTRKIVFLASEDWALLRHRQPMIHAARAAGLDPVVVCRNTGLVDEIRALGVTVEVLDLGRGSTSPVTLVKTARALAAVYRRHDPILVHHFNIQMCLVGTLAARLAGVSGVINSFTGLGNLFTLDDAKTRTIRWVVMGLFRWLLSRPGMVSIVQNDDDAAEIRPILPKTGHELIKIVGSGVDTAVFYPATEGPPLPMRAICVTRMLKHKGIAELVDAARLLKQRDVAVEIVLVGDEDPGNPASHTNEELQRWHEEGVVTWLGPRRDIPDVYRSGHVAVLPSYYREGLPKALLEGAACGLCLVTTDWPGCRELVHHDQNGLLVPPRAAEPLADALARLADDPDLRRRLAAAALARATGELSAQAVTEQATALYRRMLAN